MAGLFTTLVSFGVAAQPAQDPDWPCIQRLVPSLSAGQIWRGPPIDETVGQWSDDTGIASLVGMVTSRRLSIDQAVERIEAYADALDPKPGANRNDQLTALFAGIFERTDESRKSAISGIKRYSRAQSGLLDRMSADLVELDALRQEPTQEAERIDALSQSIDLNRQIIADRQRALRPLCEQPVLMEERLGALARAIMARLD